jgi:hypothetical protein
MSSIYKKGRDGYFYYQAYVYNPITKKKDKKIYHSLGTKNRDEALRKQIQFDLAYNNNQKKRKFIYIRKSLKFILATCLLIFIIKIGIFNSNEKNFENLSSKPVENMVADNLVDIKNEYQIQVSEQENPIEPLNYTPEEIILPAYTIHRLTSSANSFKQVKIFITVNKYSSEKQLKLLCDNIKNDNPQYENLLICIYKNNDLGINIAKGLHPRNNKKDLESVWLVLYSYNSVEGVYFDSKPSVFLSNS